MLWGDADFHHLIDKLTKKRTEHYASLKKNFNKKDHTDWKNACSAVALFKDTLRQIQRERNTPNQSSNSEIQITKVVLKELMKINFPELMRKVEKELDDNETVFKFQVQRNLWSVGEVVDIMEANTKKLVFDFNVVKEYEKMDCLKKKLSVISETCQENQNAYRDAMDFLSQDSSSRNPNKRYLQTLLSQRNRRNEETLQKVKSLMNSIRETTTDFAKMDCMILEDPDLVPNVALFASKHESNKTKVVLDGLMTVVHATSHEQSGIFRAAHRVQEKMQELTADLERYHSIFLADCNYLWATQSVSALKSQEALEWRKKENELNIKYIGASAKISNIQKEVEAMELELPNFRIARLAHSSATSCSSSSSEC